MPPVGHHHGNLIVVQEHGVLIIGVSGSGKTALTLELLQQYSARDFFARLISDDQVLLSVHGSRLVGHVPPAISGLAEARGFGPASLAYEPAAVVDLVVSLGTDGSAPRYQAGENITLEGITLPCLCLACGDPRAAARAIAACLQLPPFGFSYG